MINAITIIGLVAATFTTICLFPQLVKVWKTKSTRDISAGMFSLYCGGLLLWFIYGVYIDNLPIMLANSLAFIQALVILLFKLKYK
jgi:MtN3 and saliva related transmembrane protein